MKERWQEDTGNFGRGSHWIRDEKRERIYGRDGWTCWVCGCLVARAPALAAGSPGKLATLDHVIPRRNHGGTNDANNLATCCCDCNNLRGDEPAVEWALAELGDGAPAALARLLRCVCSPLPSSSRESPTTEAAE